MNESKPYHHVLSVVSLVSAMRAESSRSATLLALGNVRSHCEEEAEYFADMASSGEGKAEHWSAVASAIATLGGIVRDVEERLRAEQQEKEAVVLPCPIEGCAGEDEDTRPFNRNET